MNEEVVEIHFDPKKKDSIPAEVLAALPPDKIDEYLDGMEEGDAVYRCGPAPTDIDLVSYHDSSRAITPDRPTWYVPLDDARNYTLIDSVHDTRQVVTKAPDDAAVPTSARDYAAGPGLREDVTEGVALRGVFGPHDAESHLHVPKGAIVETIESRAAPQQGPDKEGGYPARMSEDEVDDYRVGPHRYPGGNRQVLVIKYDADKCQVTPRVRSVDLSNDPQSRRAAAAERMQKAALRNDNEGWDRAKAEYENAAEEEQKLRENREGASQSRGASMT